MAESASERNKAEPGLYSVSAIVKATGLSEHALRAWERRYSAIEPQRSPKGTRRYSEQDLRRLVLLKRAVDSGHRIGAIAELPTEEVEGLVQSEALATAGPLAEILRAVGALDASEVEKQLAVQFAALGPTNFARYVAQPLLIEIGMRWESGTMSIASEHLASGIMRSILGVALRNAESSDDAARILLTTPAGERHEFGLLIAALHAASAGHELLYLGADMPAADTAEAAIHFRADAVLLAATSISAEATEQYCAELGRLLPRGVKRWIGGPVVPLAQLKDSFTKIHNFEDLETKVADLESSDV